MGSRQPCQSQSGSVGPPLHWVAQGRICGRARARKGIPSNDSTKTRSTEYAARADLCGDDRVELQPASPIAGVGSRVVAIRGQHGPTIRVDRECSCINPAKSTDFLETASGDARLRSENHRCSSHRQNPSRVRVFGLSRSAGGQRAFLFWNASQWRSFPCHCDLTPEPTRRNLGTWTCQNAYTGWPVSDVSCHRGDRSRLIRSGQHPQFQEVS